MPFLTDLTLAQLTTAYGAIAGIPVKPKFFNSRAKAIAKLEALLAKKGMTVDDVWQFDPRRQANVLFPPFEPFSLYHPPTPEPAAGDDNEADAAPEAAGACDADDEESADLPGTTSAPDEDPAAAPGQPAATPDQAGTAAPDAPVGTTGLPGFLAEPAARTAILKGFAEVLISLGHTPDEAGAAAGWLERAIAQDSVTQRPAHRRTTQEGAPRTPREGSKQQAVIALLRRPEGATLARIMAETGWQPHTTRGMIAGTLKKHLGLTVTSTKEADGQRVYRIAD